MKKIIVTLCALCITVTFASAQGGAAKRKEEIKQGLKVEAKLTDDQVASTVAIENEFRLKIREVNNDQNLDAKSKKEKIAAIRGEKENKLEATLGKDAAKRVEDFYASQKKKKSSASSTSSNKPKK